MESREQQLEEEATGTAELTDSDRKVNKLQSRQNDCLLADDIYKCIFSEEMVVFLFEIQHFFFQKVPLGNK